MVNNQNDKLLFYGRGWPGDARIHGLLGEVTPRPYVGERKKMFKLQETSTYHSLEDERAIFLQLYEAEREIWNFQLTGEKYLIECANSAHKITRENTPGHVWKCTYAKLWVGIL